MSDTPSSPATLPSRRWWPLRRRRADEFVQGSFVRGDELFLQGARQARLTETTPQALWAIYLMILFVAVALVWASQARVDVITRAQGRVVPEAREQVIASLEGGLLRELRVREGALVEVGDELLQLDPTRAVAQHSEGLVRRVALLGTVARLQAEAGGRALDFPPEVRRAPKVVADETAAYQARRRLLDEALAMARHSVSLIDTELETARQMSARGLMSEVEVLHLQRQRNDLEQQQQERVNRFRQDASTELLRVQAELAALGEQQVVRDDVVRRTTINAPVRGIVKNIRISTVGGVVAAGAPIMEIVPLGDRVLVEARVAPADIGFIHVGQQAQVKLSTYDYYTYGGLDGVIEYLSPDALGEERPAGAQQDNSYYRVRIRTDGSKLRSASGELLPVLPGMTASVEIRTGARTVMDFLLRPVIKSREEAFHER
ncbi:MAG: hypothetical protein RJA44_392 [Pseudomonadota bacterium]